MNDFFDFNRPKEKNKIRKEIEDFFNNQLETTDSNLKSNVINFSIVRVTKALIKSNAINL